MSKVEQVAALRLKGATVLYDTENNEAAVHVYTRSMNYINIDCIAKVLQILHMKAVLGDITEVDKLLLSILEDSNII